MTIEANKKKLKEINHFITFIFFYIASNHKTNWTYFSINFWYGIPFTDVYTFIHSHHPFIDSSKYHEKNRTKHFDII